MDRPTCTPDDIAERGEDGDAEDGDAEDGDAEDGGGDEGGCWLDENGACRNEGDSFTDGDWTCTLLDGGNANPDFQEAWSCTR